MGNTFEVWDWKNIKDLDFEWVICYSGEIQEEAFAELNRLKDLGRPCVKLIWR